MESAEGAYGESGRVGGCSARTPENRVLRPIPLVPGTGRDRASRCQLLVPVPDPNTEAGLRPVEKCERPVPSPTEQLEDLWFILS